jgi:hypothetical protein
LLPLVPGVFGSQRIEMDAALAFALKDAEGRSVAQGRANELAFLPLGDPVRDREVAFALVDDTGVPLGGKYSRAAVVAFTQGATKTAFREGGLQLCLRELMPVTDRTLQELCMAMLTMDRAWHCAQTVVKRQQTPAGEGLLCAAVSQMGTFTVVNQLEQAASTRTTTTRPTAAVSPAARSDVPLEIVIPVAVALLLIACGMLYLFAVVKPRIDRRREAARKADIEAAEMQQPQQQQQAARAGADELAPRALAEFVGGRDVLAAEEERRQRRNGGAKASVPASSRDQKEQQRVELQLSRQHKPKTGKQIVRSLGRSARERDDAIDVVDDVSTHSLSEAIDEVRTELDAVSKHGRFVEGKSAGVAEWVYSEFPELASMSAAETRKRHKDLKRELDDLRAERDGR